MSLNFSSSVFVCVIFLSSCTCRTGTVCMLLVDPSAYCVPRIPGAAYTLRPTHCAIASTPRQHNQIFRRDELCCCLFKACLTQFHSMIYTLFYPCCAPPPPLPFLPSHPCPPPHLPTLSCFSLCPTLPVVSLLVVWPFFLCVCPTVIIAGGAPDSCSKIWEPQKLEWVGASSAVDMCHSRHAATA